ncbi:cation:proton antiporter [Vagococcus vulneris]|nr:sodium:proton antiporter [Vagococcus vulneris]
MALLESIILLIILVVVSNIISHYLVVIPTAIIQIALGIVAAIFLDVNIHLETDWFMLLFIAPLLYSDAKHFPKKDLWELRAPIFANAIWLVLLTTLLGGVLIHLLIPPVSLSLAFALAAVLSPTDPVAVQGIAEQVKLPKRLLNLVNGESLINDASGLIVFKYALAAFLTGQFSLRTATTDFLYLCIAAVIVGIVGSKIMYVIEGTLLRQGIQDTILHTSLQILTPFIIFIAAESVHASGVIAVVVSGVMSIQQEPLYRSQLSEIQLVTSNLWDIIIYLLNGVIFLILGSTLPKAMHSAIINPAVNNYNLILYVIIIWLILLLIRTFWSYGYMWYNYIKVRKHDLSKPKFKTALLTGLTGVRGAITMVMVLSIPFYLPNGDLFKERYLIIFLAGGVIVTSLLGAMITLPIMTKGKKRLILAHVDNNSTDDNTVQSVLDVAENQLENLTEIEAKTLMTKRAIKVLESERNDDNHFVVTELLDDLDKQLKYLYLTNEKTSNDYYHDIEVNYLKIAVNAEFQAVLELDKMNAVSNQLIKNYLKMLTYKKKSHSTNIRIVFKQAVYRTKRITKRIIFHNILKQKFSEKDRKQEIFLLEKTSAERAVAALQDECDNIPLSDENYQLKMSIINQISLEYQYKIERINYVQSDNHSDYQLLHREFYLKTLDAERAVIQKLLEKGRISTVLASQLRQTVNYNETTFLQGNLED